MNITITTAERNHLISHSDKTGAEIDAMIAAAQTDLEKALELIAFLLVALGLCAQGPVAQTSTPPTA